MLNIVFMSVAVLHSSDPSFISETVSLTSPDQGSHGLFAVSNLPLTDMSFTPMHTH